MKRNIFLGLIIVLLLSVVMWKAYAAYTTEFTSLEVQNLVIFEIFPEPDNPGDPPPPMELGLAINITLTNVGGENLGYTRRFDLTTQQKTQITNFVIPFVQSLGTELDVVIPSWAQSVVNVHSLFFNVFSFGATGDGSTDDSTAIQAALTACKTAGGGMVLIPPGTYLCSAGLLIDSSKIQIRGAGAATVLQFTHAGNGLYTDDSKALNYITIRDLRIETTNAAAGVGIYADQTTFSSSVWLLDNVHIGISGAGEWDQCIYLKKVQSSTMNSVWLMPGTTGTGIYFDDSANAWGIFGLKIGGFYTIGVDIHSAGVWLYGGTIQGNVSDACVKIENSATGRMTLDGIWFENVHASGKAIDIIGCDAVVVSNCRVATVAVLAIEIGNTNAKGVVIQGNSFAGNIQVDADALGTAIINNRFHVGDTITDNGIGTEIRGNFDYAGLRYSDTFAVWGGAMHQMVGNCVAGCILNLEFDEGTGTTVYDSGVYGAYDGTLVNDVTWVEGLTSYALDFPGDGTGDQVECAALDLPANFSIEVMLSSDTIPASGKGVVFGRYGGYTYGNYYIGMNGTHILSCSFYDDTNTAHTIIATDPRGQLNIMNHWYHIVMTYDGSDQKIYVDGALIEEVNVGLVTPRTGTTETLIGTGRDSSHNSFDGQVEFVRFYNRALTDNEAKAYYMRNLKRSVLVSDKFRIFGTDGNLNFNVADGRASAPVLNGGIKALSYGATIAADMDDGNVFTLATTGNCTINASNGSAGQGATFIITDDATGGCVVTFGTNFKPIGTLTGTADKIATVDFAYDGTNWYEVSRITGL